MATIEMFPGKVLWTPKTLDKAKKYPAFIFLHGTGGYGPGTTQTMLSLTEGVPKGYPQVPQDLQNAVDPEEIVVLAPQIGGGEWNVAHVNDAITFLSALGYIDVDKITLAGFSLGGGGVLRYITSSLVNTKKINLAVICAPLPHGTNYTLIKDANLPTWFFHYDIDPNTPTARSVTDNAVNNINSFNPTIKAVKTIYNGTSHGFGNAFRHDIPPATIDNATFFNQPGDTVYSAAKANTKDVHVPILSIATLPPASGAPDFTIDAPTTVVGNSFTAKVINMSNVDLNRYDGVEFSFNTLDQNGSYNPSWSPAGIYGTTKTFGNLLPARYKLKVTARKGTQVTSKELTITISANPTPEPTKKLVTLELVGGGFMTAEVEKDANGYLHFKDVS